MLDLKLKTDTPSVISKMGHRKLLLLIVFIAVLAGFLYYSVFSSGKNFLVIVAGQGDKTVKIMVGK